MERVQFQQEQMLAELKDLVEKNIFTEKETRHIMKKRTAFETALVRRVAKKADFLRYASYEMGLEQLRRKRVERLKIPHGPATVSDYALVRRQFQIFERALRKFKSDVGLWVQYIQVAKREGARALVGRITARALQLHPNKPALYIMAASHELSHLSPSAARTHLQRGIRLNSESFEMWREYVRMELGFVETLRRRWDVLGINATVGDAKGKDKAQDDDPSRHFMDLDADEAPREAEAGAKMDGDEGTAARKEIMEGAIVKSVMTSAAQALPKIELFESLHSLITEYPSPPALRAALLSHLHDLLRETLPGDAGAIKMLAGRFLAPGLDREARVDGLRRANEEMLQNVGDGKREDILQAYADFVEHWCGVALDSNLKLYLISSLRLLIRRGNTSPPLLAAHIRLMTRIGETDMMDPAKVLRTARKYTTKAPKSAHVWLARLVAEKRYADSGNEGCEVVNKAWAEARGLAEGPEEDVGRVWSWGISSDDSVKDRQKVHEELLKESMRNASLQGVHEMLLMSYVTVMHEARANAAIGWTSDHGSDYWLHLVHHMGRAYLTTGKVWRKVFFTLAEIEMDGKRKLLGEVFEKWRKKDGMEATVKWASWLLRNGQGKEAGEVVIGAKSRLGIELERRWMEELGKIGEDGGNG